MNSRFEPDGIKQSLRLKELYEQYTGKKKEEIVKFPEREDEITQLIENHSNWASRLSECHDKVNANYKKIENNDKQLQKYVDQKK